jgi:hypothetical protein
MYLALPEYRRRGLSDTANRDVAVIGRMTVHGSKENVGRRFITPVFLKPGTR